MIHLDEFPELDAIKKVARHDDSVTNRYGRTARGEIDPELVRADLILLCAVIKAQDEYIRGAVG